MEGTRCHRSNGPEGEWGMWGWAALQGAGLQTTGKYPSYTHSWAKHARCKEWGSKDCPQDLETSIESRGWGKRVG